MTSSLGILYYTILYMYVYKNNNGYMLVHPNLYHMWIWLPTNWFEDLHQILMKKIITSNVQDVAYIECTKC